MNHNMSLDIKKLQENFEKMKQEVIKELNEEKQKKKELMEKKS